MSASPVTREFLRICHYVSDNCNHSCATCFEPEAKSTVCCSFGHTVSTTIIKAAMIIIILWFKHFNLDN